MSDLRKDLKDRVTAICGGGERLLLVKEDYIIEQLAKIEFEIDQRVHIVKVRDFDDIKCFDEKMLRALGWTKPEEKKKAPLIHLV